MGIVFLNGQFIPRSEARVSVLDRGFLLGDGVYEVIPAYHGKLFRLPEHLQRLQHSLSAVGMQNPMSDAQWQSVLERLLKLNPGGDLSVYLQITRGVAARDHAFPVDAKPTVFAMANAIASPDPTIAEQGIKASCLEDIRWRYCHIKSISLLANVLLRQQSVEHGNAEAILVRDGLVTEGAASNVFMVKDDTLVTPPKSQYLLPGITRDLILELAADNDIPYEERDISEVEFHQADEIWVSSSTREIVPVSELDGQAVGSGKPGPLWRRMRDLYRQYKEQLA